MDTAARQRLGEYEKAIYNGGGMKVKWIQNKLYMGIAILSMSVPLQVNAAGRDTVNLDQNGSQVGVSVEMSNATEEKITTVAVSLEVKTEDLSQVKVEFQFSAELEGAEYGFIYNENTGRLDIYVASAKSLFKEEQLSLGNVQVQPVNPNQSISADIGYCKDSFKTANSAYGDKTPVVENEVAPVTIQIGNGSLTPPGSGTDNNLGGADGTNPGNTNQGNPGANAGGSGSGNPTGGNRDEGLYDETTRFKNDPSSAESISSSVVKREGKEIPPINLTTGAAAAIAGKNGAETGNATLLGTIGKVSVISPKNGPASILVSKGEGEASAEDMPDGLVAGIKDESLTEKLGGLFGGEYAEEDGAGEIVLDQEKGGAVDNSKSERRKRILIFGAALTGAAAVIVGIGVILVKKTGVVLADSKRKKRRKKHRRKKKNARKKRRRPSSY
ncbi:hypothetical protein D5281_16550 [bacterium 1xD42-62]|uniref:Uncharacterized protein n=2 Tax=Parablautia muri TaxID=2320879 RepID=A0A9X5GUJ8_9FIRM|nr:hypothetical protein [Parablautia muri]